MTAFDEAWDFLKADESYTGQPKFGGNQKQPLDMHEYPPGSGNFMTLQDIQRKINAPPRSRANVGGQPSTNAIASQMPITPNPSREQRMNRNNIMVNSETGVYDPNDPNSWHPM